MITRGILLGALKRSRFRPGTRPGKIGSFELRQFE
jgi:hypothetical protein